MTPDQCCLQLAEANQIRLPVFQRFYNSKKISEAEQVMVKASAYYHTSQYTIPRFYKHISRCLPPVQDPS